MVNCRMSRADQPLPTMRIAHIVRLQATWNFDSREAPINSLPLPEIQIFTSAVVLAKPKHSEWVFEFEIFLFSKIWQNRYRIKNGGTSVQNLSIGRTKLVAKISTSWFSKIFFHFIAKSGIFFKHRYGSGITHYNGSIFFFCHNSWKMISKWCGKNFCSVTKFFQMAKLTKTL